jgi:uncharacterized protein YjbJ (UPF0337 family)
MDRDRVIGSAKVIKGKVNEAIGKAIGDAKLEAEGKADKIEGKVQNAVGGGRDTLRGRQLWGAAKQEPGRPGKVTAVRARERSYLQPGCMRGRIQ